MFSSFWFSCSSTMDSCIETNPPNQWHTTFHKTVKVSEFLYHSRNISSKVLLPHRTKPRTKPGFFSFCRTYLHTPANLKAGGDGGVLIVCSFGVSNQVVPAGEHLPAEGEVSFLGSVPSLIGITSHSYREENQTYLHCLWTFRKCR